MTDASTRRPPYLAAAAVAVLVFIGYLLTLAPTVTFWDAGEFIAAMKVLGIPHPPGTPMFVLLGHVWGTLFPVGEFAFRTNLLTALFSAAGAGFFFLVVHETLRAFAADMEPAAARLIRVGGAAAAAVAGGFAFTVWQNSNETEVYMVATFSIAAMCWLCHRWRAHRADEHAPRILLLIVYIAGISVGNHLLALLAGPAVVAFMIATLWNDPAPSAERRRLEWAHVAVVAGIWALLIGVGLGNTALLVLGGLCFAAAAVFAAVSGALPVALAALAIALIGVTPYLYLYIRSAQHPIINEAAPATWDALLAVIRRAQYPIRTPLDDPTVPHGAGNPGRSLTLIWLQIVNYLQYFDWQWAKGIGATVGALPVRTLFTLLFLSLGLRGSALQRRADRSAWWLLLVLFLTTGFGLVAYMNFKPGYSVGHDLYPDAGDHEVRERDYFFVVSFLVWGLWAGMGLAGVARSLMERTRGAVRPLAAGAAFAVALLPVGLNWSAATRRGGDAYLAADFAYNLLNTVPPYGILFTYGDNDTFPLWWAQEVEGIRPDVTVVCIALAATDWYMRQLRDNPVRPFDPSEAPAVWRGGNPTMPDWPLHTMSDTEINQALAARFLDQPVTVAIGPISHTYPANTILGPSDFVAIRILQQNLGRRPIVWSITAGQGFAGLREYVVQQALGYRVQPTPPDTSAAHLDDAGLAGAPLNVPLTDRLAWDTYRYRGLLEAEPEDFESTSASFAATLALPFTQLAYAYRDRGDLEAMLRNLERAVAFSPDPRLRDALEELRRQGLPSIDSARAIP